MFTHFASAAKNFLTRNQLKNTVQALTVCEQAEKIITKILKKKISVIKYQKETVYVKTNHPLLSQEVLFKEGLIKNELKKIKINVEKIRCST